MSQTIRIKRRAYSIVYDDILEDERLGWRTRVLLSWMLGRSPDFKIHIWHVRKKFKLSNQQWNQARKEMKEAGYFRQERTQTSEGKITWAHYVTDTPEPTLTKKPCTRKPYNG